MDPYRFYSMERIALLSDPARERLENGIEKTDLGNVRFVPLLRGVL